jgi:MFS family permease
LFFVASDPAVATLQSLATFGIAFFARPVGSALFGHFGDRIGRKATLVASLLTMGLSTVLIGLLPSYASIGIAAPLLLALCRFGQGLGLGGEWGGAVLLAIENAPPGKRAWYGMFPQLGGPLGFFLSGCAFLLLTTQLSPADFLDWGWRLPFLASGVLVMVGLYVRLNIAETPAFQDVLHTQSRVRIPVLSVFRQHRRVLVLGTVAAMAQFVLFYLTMVFALSWSTTHLGYARSDFLVLQLIAAVFFGLAIPLSARISSRFDAATAVILASLGIVLFGFALEPSLASGNLVVLGVFLATGMALMGLSFGPLGTLLSGLFPAEVRYTGSSVAFNLGGILGASLAPFAATWLATRYGLAAVGYYLSFAALLSAWALLALRRHQASAPVVIS